MSVAGYVIVFSDEDYNAIFPEIDIVPPILHRTIESASAAIDTWAKTFNRFRSALYGQAYPYESTTLINEIVEKGAAVYGWAEMTDEDGEMIRYALCIKALRSA
jgi:hypothetical protein